MPEVVPIPQPYDELASMSELLIETTPIDEPDSNSFVPHPVPMPEPYEELLAMTTEL
jgi:hypothetical protein